MSYNLVDLKENKKLFFKNMKFFPPTWLFRTLNQQNQAYQNLLNLIFYRNGIVGKYQCQISVNYIKLWLSVNQPKSATSASTSSAIYRLTDTIGPLIKFEVKKKNTFSWGILTIMQLEAQDIIHRWCGRNLPRLEFLHDLHNLHNLHDLHDLHDFTDMILK